MSDFDVILAQSQTEKLFTPYVPDMPPEQMSGAYRPLGLPADPAYNLPPPGFESTLGVEEGMPLITSIQGVWDSVKSNASGLVGAVEHGVEGVYETGKKAVKSVYGDVSGGVGKVFGDISNPLTSTLKTGFWYALLGVVVLGGVVYFVGKSGAVRVAIPI